MAKKETKQTAVEKMKAFNERPENTGGITRKQKLSLETVCDEK